jgi:hypothetical protein
MKRILIGSLTALALVGCSKSASVHVVLGSSDATTAAAQPAPGTAYLTTGADDDLTTVKSVTVTVAEVDAHVSGEGDKEIDEKTEEVDGAEVPDDDGKWQVVSSTPVTVDLMTLRDGLTQPLGIATLPDGKITQLRLKLATDSAAADGKDVIAGAVVDSAGNVCDLLVPHSAFQPGVKINQVFKAMPLTAGDQHLVQVNLQLRDSQRDDSAGGCAYFLNPVIRIEKFEDEGPAHEGDDAEHEDAGSEVVDAGN